MSGFTEKNRRVLTKPLVAHIKKEVPAKQARLLIDFAERLYKNVDHTEL